VKNKPLLELSNLTAGYTEADIIFDLDISVLNKEIVVIVGPNGAGKSTALKSVFGFLKIRGGTIKFAGKEITGFSSNKIVRSGISYVPQVNNIFHEMTVEENLEMGGFIRKDDIGVPMERVYKLFPDLVAKKHAIAGTLSGGQRQMVAIGRALMLDPLLLLLDEPTAGLSPKYMEQIFQIVRDVRDDGVAIMLVEQHAKQALALADRGYVLATGRNRHEGTGKELLENQEIAKMFLGG
jgi:branched-chain amino acid transport system ATP-binding protein